LIRFLITTHGHLPGVRLSMIGNWGNIPFPDADKAADIARWHADGRPHKIERKAFPALPGFRREQVNG
jgi:hypothetical protein